MELHVRINPQADRTRELATTTTVVLVLSVIFVALRLWARHIRNGYGLDDWLTAVALVSLAPRLAKTCTT
jgi:hypothetical protein